MNQVEEIKQKIDIVQVIGERVGLKKAGRNYKGLCPFHSEKTPSFMVSPELGIFKCFGCGESGDVFSFLEKYEGMTFLEALEYSAERVGVKLERYKPSEEDLRQKRLMEIMDLASEFYAWILNEHEVGEKGRDYLQKRKVFNEARKSFKLGYAPKAWRSVSDFLIKKKGYRVEELVAVGLVIQKGERYYDRFRGRIMFPLRDARGRVLGFSGRIVDGEGEAKYINSPETVLYAKRKMLYGLFENKQAIKKENGVVLVEGEMDMIASWQAGIRNVVAIKGSVFTEEQAQLIKRYTPNIVMALDADVAGEEAVKRAMEIADRLELNVRVVEIGGGKDPGEVASGDPKRWREMVRGAVSYYDFLLGSLIKREDLTKEEGIKKVMREFGGALIRVSNVVVRAHYLKKLAERLGLPEKAVYEELERMEKRVKLARLQTRITEIEQKKGLSRRERLEEYVLALLFQGLEVVGERGKKLIKEEWFDNPALRKIYRVYRDWKGKWSPKKMAQELPPELQEKLDRVLLQDLSEVGEKWEREFERSVKELEELFIRGELERLAEEIAKVEREGREEKLKNLQSLFAQLTKRLASLDEED